MAKATLERVMEQVRDLRPEEQRQVRELLDSLLGDPAENAREDEFERRMAEAGLLIIPQGGPIVGPDDDFEPVKVTGPPVSQTIIDERR